MHQTKENNGQNTRTLCKLRDIKARIARDNSNPDLQFGLFENLWDPNRWYKAKRNSNSNSGMIVKDVECLNDNVQNNTSTERKLESIYNNASKGLRIILDEVQQNGKKNIS